MRVLRRSVAAALLVAGLAAAPAVADPPQITSTTNGLTTGFFDPIYTSKNTTMQTDWFDRSASVKAGIVRISPYWSDVVPNRPGGDTSDPANPAYDWSFTDAAVRDAQQRGIEVLLTLNRAPKWAEGPNRDSSAPDGSWNPDVAAYKQFVIAAARRYNGDYPDPANPGQNLPRVTYYQMWNEPNLSRYLSPQWVKSGGQFQMSSPSYYRRLLNAGYDAVKSVNGQDVVVAAGTAPYGDYVQGANRIPPAQFLRAMLCLNVNLQATCNDVSKFDIASHHPYSIEGTYRRARNADDVAVPDMLKLQRPLRVAVQLKHVFPAVTKPLWTTEISWDSNPPDPDAATQRRQAEWLSETFFLLWRQGIRTISWYLNSDALPNPSYAATYQSGVFTYDGTPKLSATAFRMPFVAWRNSKHVRFWVSAPAGSPLSVQQQVGSEWREVATATGGIVQGRFDAISNGPVRIVSGDFTTLPVQPGRGANG